MPLPRETILCQYRYDALDRVISQLPARMPQHQRFYCKSRLATEIQGVVRHSIFQQADHLLAQQRYGDGTFNTSLLATDQQRSVLHTLKANHQRQTIGYSPYGHSLAANGLLSLLGFNGERPDPVTGHYLLGNGYRAFNPVLMRFNSPDSLSPFGKGGLNSYTYCLGDPVNSSDASGHIVSKVMASILKSLHETDPTSYRSLFVRMSNRGLPARARRLSDPGPILPSLEEAAFLGYHGTNSVDVKALLKRGVTPIKLVGRDWRGFFFSPDLATTTRYAGFSERRMTGLIPRKNQQFGKANIVEVHVNRFNSMKPGVDYDYNYHPSGDVKKPHSMEFFTAHHKARSVVIRELGSTPETKKVRPRAHEAPF